MDGAPLGGAVDTYSEAVVAGPLMPLGKCDLAAGRHVLRFQAVEHNPESKGYLMGIDHIILR